MNRETLLKHLRRLDEVTLMELLELTSDDLVDVFLDKIIDKYDYIKSQLEDEEE